MFLAVACPYCDNETVSRGGRGGRGGAWFPSLTVPALEDRRRVSVRAAASPAPWLRGSVVPLPGACVRVRGCALFIIT